MNPINRQVLKMWKAKIQEAKETKKLTDSIFKFIKQVNVFLPDDNKFANDRTSENYLYSKGVFIHISLPGFPSTFSTQGIFLIRLRENDDYKNDEQRYVINLDLISQPKDVAEIIVKLLNTNGVVPVDLVNTQVIISERFYRRSMAKRIDVDDYPEYDELKRSLGLKA